jgi:hypothetical protein
MDAEQSVQADRSYSFEINARVCHSELLSGIRPFGPGSDGLPQSWTGCLSMVIRWQYFTMAMGATDGGAGQGRPARPGRHPAA